MYSSVSSHSSPLGVEHIIPSLVNPLGATALRGGPGIPPGLLAGVPQDTS